MTLEVINPIAGKGIGSRTDPVTGQDRGYRANDYKTLPNGDPAPGSQTPDETNSIDIGVIVRDDSKRALDSVTVSFEATDEKQNAKYPNTGSITKTYADPRSDISQKTPYYPYHYEFRTTGKHTITITCQRMKEVIELTVT